MTLLDYLFDLFKILIPASAVVIVVQVMLKSHFDDLRTREQINHAREQRKDLKPLQMQAYERLILFLERIQPDNLMIRNQKPGMSARTLHTTILRNIRQEYEHNLSQQLYVSEPAWKLVVAAKNEVTKIINLAASQLGEDQTAMDLGNEIMNVVMKLDKVPTDVAIHGLKKEFQSKF
jgi:uncharacterized protein YihD (DUF1040 family)